MSFYIQGVIFLLIREGVKLVSRTGRHTAVYGDALFLFFGFVRELDTGYFRQFRALLSLHTIIH